MPDPDFCLERAKTCNLAVKYLFSWAQAMYDYNKVFTQTKPLRDKLEATRKVLAEKTAYLNAK
jgi:dynein heavy chain, axonemal